LYNNRTTPQLLLY